MKRNVLLLANIILLLVSIFISVKTYNKLMTIIIPGENPLQNLESPISQSVEAVARFRTVQNSSGSDIIDDTGLVSTTNFPNDNYFASGQITTNSTSFVDVSGSSLTFDLDRTTNVLIIYSVQLQIGHSSSSTSYSESVTVNIDSSDETNMQAVWRDIGASAGAVRAVTVTSHIVKSLGSGSHTIKLRHKTSDASATARMFDRSLTYIVLGS